MGASHSVDISVVMLMQFVCAYMCVGDVGWSAVLFSCLNVLVTSW